MTLYSPIEKQQPGTIVKRLYLCRHGETDANAEKVMQGSGIDLSLNTTVSILIGNQASRIIKRSPQERKTSSDKVNAYV